MKCLDNNPFMDEVRAAYRKSPAFRAISEGKPVPGTVAEALPREPGSDDESNVAGPERPAVKPARTNERTTLQPGGKHPEGPLAIGDSASQPDPATPKKPVEYRPDMSVEEYERYLGELSEKAADRMEP